MQLTPHFSLEELTRSEMAARLGLDNTPTDEVLSNLYMLANGLERVRSVLGCPVRISSGYRSPKVNAAVKGAVKSQHCNGEAADITSPDFGSPRDIAMKLITERAFVNFDQLILEFDSWVHISFTDTPRNQVLTAAHTPTGTEYTVGIK